MAGTKMNRVRELVHAEDAHRMGIKGTGVTVAVMDTGIADHPDFSHRILDFVDFTAGRSGMYDDNGHGTHVCGIIGGTGFASRGRYMGIAPGVRYVVIRVLDKMGNGNTTQVIRAIEWLIRNHKRYNIRILNISVGMLSSAREEERERLLEAVERVWEEQIVVVTAAGNNGPEAGSVTIPGMSKTVITVGSSDDETAIRGRIRMGTGYSGRGPTESCIVKPEIVAPGTKVVSCSNRMSYETKSGTSMATPVVTGAIALLLERYPYLTPVQVKLRLYETAVDLGKPRNTQGWGMIDIRRLL
ncbi:MAG: S8 family peptidase [Lachnospiraceae bacterium]|nr:S8 family peptidase [Lachnospiraceae bacterium]